jgi:hypothetical protein
MENRANRAPRPKLEWWVSSPCWRKEDGVNQIDDILGQRGTRYGVFVESALVAQNVKAAMRHSAGWHSLPADAREALEMTATKVARILCGDPLYVDSWRDIEGYARLVADRLESSHSTSED